MTSQTDRVNQTRENIFAIADPKDFGVRIAARVKEWTQISQGTAFALHYGNAGIAYTHLYGLDVEGQGANAAVITRSGEQGTIAELRIPAAAGDLRKVWNVIVGPELAWGAVATTTDYASDAKVITAKNALQYYWNDLDVATKAKAMAFEALAFGEAAMHVPWNEDLGEDIAADPMVDQKTGEPVLDENGEPRHRIIRTGDIDNRPVSTWDIIRDPTYKSYRAQPFALHREWENRYEVAARCRDEETAQAALQAPYNPQEIYRFWRPFNTSSQIASDLIPVYYLYHRRTGAIWRGRQTVFLENGSVISDGPLDRSYWKTLPLVRIAAGEYAGTPFPYTKWVGTLGAAQAGDALARDLLTNATAVSGGLVIAEEDSNMAPLQLGGGPKILYKPKGSASPEPLALQQSHPEHFKLLQTLRGEGKQILGLDRLTAGEDVGATWSGAMAALVTSTTVQNNSQEQSAWGKFVQGIGNVHLAHIQHHMQEPRLIALAGKSRADLVITTKLSSSEVEGIDRVQVTLAPALQQTDAGKMELGQQALKQGWAKTPQQLQSVFDTGRLDALLEDGSSELLLIKNENEALAKGEAVPVMLGDDHLLHLRGHRPVTASTVARKDEAVIKAAQAHEAEHLRILKTTDPRILQLFGQPSLAPTPEAQPQGPSEATKLGAAALAVKSGWAPTAHDAQRIFETGKIDAGAAPLNPAAGGNPAQGTAVAPQQQAKAAGPSLPTNPQTGRPAGPVAGTPSGALAVRPAAPPQQMPRPPAGPPQLPPKPVV